MNNKTEELTVIEVSDTYKVTFKDGKTKELFMTLGLVQALSGSLISIDQLINITMDNLTMNRLLNVVLADRDEQGKIISPEKDYTLEVSIKEGENLISWVVKHITNFFTSNFQKIQDIRDDLKPVTDLLQELAALQKPELNSEPLQDGLKDSTSNS